MHHPTGLDVAVRVASVQGSAVSLVLKACVVHAWPLPLSTLQLPFSLANGEVHLA